MSELGKRLARHIAARGPMTVAEYMSEALTHPEHGYYRNTDPLGSAGDFVTAPEISQLFGELIGAWLMDSWERLGRPDPVQLIELGPGRGTLMSDALRVGRTMPGWLDAAELHLVEINQALRQFQAERLSAYRPSWHDSLDTVPDGPMLLVANEFFDALPIRQLAFTRGSWRERLVDWNAETGFRFVLSASPSPLALLIPPAMPEVIEGSIVELSPVSIGIADRIARRIAEKGGAALLIDYGRLETLPGASLQAVRRHRKVDIFETPGEADLSAHVDFAALARCAREGGAQSFGPIDQGQFLDILGISHRAEHLKAKASPGQATALDQAIARLTGSDGMGELFKVLAIVSRGLIPAGFPS